MTPPPNAKQKAACDRLAGLPFVFIEKEGHKVIGELSNGEKVRAVELEEVFNAGLCIDAMEGPGAAARQTLVSAEATKLHHELIAKAEAFFGISIRDACPIWLAMEKTFYARWDERPKVRWPRPAVN
jgi:hypothetical protein